MKRWWLEQADIREFLTVMGVGLPAYLVIIFTVIMLWYAP